MRPFVFLDRDGTLIVEKNYLADPEGVELIEGAADALRRLRESGFGISVVTNQSGVGRGFFAMDRVDAVHERIRKLLGDQGASIDSFHACPHVPDEGCACRKPGTAMIDAAAAEHSIDLGASFMIGDKECDIVCGKNAGMTSILVQTGYGRTLGADARSQADFVAQSLPEAVGWILRRLEAR